MINKIKEVDNKITDYINKKCTSKPMDAFMKIITFLGDYALIWASIIIYLFIKGKTTEGMSLICALASTSLLNEKILKKIFKRVRPAKENCYENLVIKIPSSYSFPSGHTATAFAVLPMAMIFGGVIGLISLISAFTIGFSRIYLKVHYFSDVLVGAIIGSTISLSTYAFVFL